jgi:REP element-mobilizing transposase RayT
MKNAQKRKFKFLKDQPLAYGGDLLKTRKGRSCARPLDTRGSMHLVLRSTKAKGDWSFWRPKNKIKIKQIVAKFSNRYRIKILSMANVGNHLHFHIKLIDRNAYKPFIRAITAAIAMSVAGVSRWRPSKQRANQSAKNNTHQDTSENKNLKKVKDHFWDRRPFTRVVQGVRAFLTLKNYIQINQLEGFGCSRAEARFFMAKTEKLNSS